VAHFGGLDGVPETGTRQVDGGLIEQRQQQGALARLGGKGIEKNHPVRLQQQLGVLRHQLIEVVDVGVGQVEIAQGGSGATSRPVILVKVVAPGQYDGALHKFRLAADYFPHRFALRIHEAR
jgi:hypothetical protein